MLICSVGIPSIAPRYLMVLLIICDCQCSYQCRWYPCARVTCCSQLSTNIVLRLYPSYSVDSTCTLKPSNLPSLPGRSLRARGKFHQARQGSLSLCLDRCSIHSCSYAVYKLLEAAASWRWIFAPLCSGQSGLGAAAWSELLACAPSHGEAPT